MDAAPSELSRPGTFLDQFEEHVYGFGRGRIWSFQAIWRTAKFLEIKGFSHFFNLWNQRATVERPPKDALSVQNRSVRPHERRGKLLRLNARFIIPRHVQNILP